MPLPGNKIKGFSNIRLNQPRAALRFLWSSVRGRLTLLVGAVTLPAFFLAALLIGFSFSNEKKAVSEHLLGTTRACCALVDSHVEHRLTLLRSLSSSALLMTDNVPGFLERAARSLDSLNISDHVLTVHDPSGAPLISTAPDGRMRPLSVNAVANSALNKDFVSDFQQSPVDQSPEVFVSSPVYRNGRLKYILSLRFNPAVFTQITAIPGLAPNAIVGIMDRNKVLLARSQRATEFVGRQVSAIFLASSRGKTSGVIPSQTLEGVSVLSSFQISSVTGWGVVIGAPRSELYASGIKLLATGLVGIGALALVAIVMARWIGRAVVYEVESLVEDVGLVGQRKIPDARNSGLYETDLVAQAVRTNGRMLHERERQSAALFALVARVNQAAKLQEVYEAALDAFCQSQTTQRSAILILDEAGVAQFVAWRGLSDHYRHAVTGHSPWRPDEPAPQPVLVEDITHAHFDPQVTQALRAEKIGALVFIPLTYENKLLGKCMVYCEQPTTFSVLDQETLVALASQVAFAIARQRAADALESLVDQRTASLREAVAHMREFSHSVSHDLRAPVRAISNYASAFLEDYGNGVPADGRKLLEKIVHSGHRMDQLIRDLLAYSQISQVELQLERVDVAALIHDIVQQHPELQPPHATIALPDELPAVLAHAPTLAQAITNLLSNAVKFVAPGKSPLVTISALRTSNRVNLVFQDNGIGIAPKYHGRIFSPFERLHGSEYEGTGIGLSIVKKAMDRMQGTVTVESDLEAGSRFTLQLPRA